MLYPPILLQDYLYPITKQGEGWVCLALTQFLQISIIHTRAGVDASSLETTKPAKPAQNPNIIMHQLVLLQHNFPQLSPRAISTSHTLIAQGLGVIATQYQHHQNHDELFAVKNAG